MILVVLETLPVLAACVLLGMWIASLFDL